MLQCPTSRRNNANQHYLPYIYICTCAGTKQLDIHKTYAVTLTGKRPPNRDSELQRTELVQDTRALMEQDTKTGDEDGIWNGSNHTIWLCQIFIHFTFTPINNRPVFGGENTLTNLKTLCALDVHDDKGRKHSFFTTSETKPMTFSTVFQMNKRE